MAHVRVARLGCGVVVDVDDIVQHANGRADGLGDERLVELAILQVRHEVHRAEVANGGFLGGGIQQNFRTKIRAVHHAAMILRRTEVRGVLERDPRMARFEEHHQHLAPQILRLYFLEELNLARSRQRLVLFISLFKCSAIQVVQIRHVARAKERPLAMLLHAFHEQVRNPVGRVHVVRASAVVAGIAAQVEEILNVQVPRLEVRAHRAFALAALVHGDRCIVGDFQKRNHALAFAVGALNVRAGSADVRPVIPQPAGPFGKLGVVAHHLEDVVEIIVDRAEVAR